MRTKYFNCEVLALVVLTIIPWPGPSVFKISCPRDSAAIVRKIIQKKWTPILEKYQVKVPIECPFHPMRDIFGPQQAAKHQHRPSQWSCGFCGKSFYEEKFLEVHFDNRHKSRINMAEDAVCLADYCDIMRCEVLLTQDMADLNDPHHNTDIEIWREATAYRTALTITGPRDIARIPFTEERTHKTSQLPQSVGTPPPPINTPPPKTDQPLCSKQKSSSTSQEETSSTPNNPSNDSDGNATSETCDNSDLVDSALPPSVNKQQRLSELQRLKANCKPEQLQKLRQRCETLVRDCIAGLLVNLSVQDFKEVEEQLNRAVCWYLTCDRYWEDTQGDTRPFPWGLVFVLVMVLSLGICMVYYLIWVLFDSEEGSVTSASASATASPLHTNSRPGYPDEYYRELQGDVDVTQNEHYIYVTYPPELKRRLLESCYNRTTRL